ncbi:hypothetical protein ACFCV7_07930, partial [Enterococcus faecium]|uniref:hypothetical protein n=1 Tax=Enterococcus faecium TaxID=1352 RepID=UPI0035E34F43
VTKVVSQLPFFFSIKGVKKVSSAVISLTKRKKCGAIFAWVFLIIETGQLFHNLLFCIKVILDSCQRTKCILLTLLNCLHKYQRRLVGI